MEGVVVSDHDVPVASIFWVPRLAIGIDLTIFVYDADEKAASIITTWCLSGADAIYSAYSPAIPTEPGLETPSIGN